NCQPSFLVRMAPKKFSKIFWSRREKTKTPLDGAAFILSEDEVASSHRLDARIETRHAACRGVLRDDAADGAALDLRLSRTQGGHGRLLVAGGDRFLDLLDRAAHPAAADAVHGRAPLGLTGALLGRLVTSHSILVPRKGALIRTAVGRVNPAKRP